jgi:hypothetical protein
MTNPNRLPERNWLQSRFRRRPVRRGTRDDGDRWYEDDDGRRHASVTTVTGNIDFSSFPEESPLFESQWPLRKWKENTLRWWVKYWYKRQLGILGHYRITSQMDVSTPDDTVEAREELIHPSDDSVRHHTAATLFETICAYDDVGLAAEGWEYDRYPADHPLLDVAEQDADEIGHLWRTTIRPELHIGYGDVWRGELKFIRLLDGDAWPPVGYGGQIDLVAEMRSKLRAVDIKTGTLRTSHRMQAVAYQHAFPELEGAALVHVSPTGEWEVEWSEDWPTESLWQQFRAEVISAEGNDEFDFDS